MFKKTADLVEVATPKDSAGGLLLPNSALEARWCLVGLGFAGNSSRLESRLPWWQVE